MYRLNQQRFVWQMLPPHRRQRKRVALFELMLSPFVKLYDDFNDVYLRYYQDSSLAPQVMIVVYRLAEILGVEPEAIVVLDVQDGYLGFKVLGEVNEESFLKASDFLKNIKPYGLPQLGIFNEL